MTIWPPVTSAAARNGAAFDKSGSTSIRPGFRDPGRTRHESGTAGPDPADQASTSAPAAASIAAVIAMCGADGTGGPSCRMTTPVSYRGAASSSPDTSCDDDD